MVDDYDAMLTAVLILVSPVIFALPVSSHGDGGSALNQSMSTIEKRFAEY